MIFPFLKFLTIHLCDVSKNSQLSEQLLKEIIITLESAVWLLFISMLGTG